MTGLDARPLTSNIESDWLSLVEGHDAATPFHSLRWKRAVATAFGYEPRYRLWYSGNEPVAALPAFAVPGLGGEDLTNPFCEYGHPIIERRDLAVDVLADVREWTGRFDAVIVKDATWTGVRGYSPATFGGVETGVVRRLPLDRPFETLSDVVVDRSLRKNVRRARENGVRVEEARDCKQYYDIYLETMRRLGSPPFPISFFDALDDEFGSEATTLLAHDGDAVVAGLMSVQWSGTRSLWSNASKRDAWRRRPNDLLYYEAVRRATKAGVTVVDFGRSEPGSGVDDFKRQFGATAFPMTSYVFPPRYTSRASISGYKRLAPVARALSPVISHPKIGPRLKRWIHE